METSEPPESSCISILFHNQRGFAYTSCVQNVFAPCQKNFRSKLFNKQPFVPRTSCTNRTAFSREYLDTSLSPGNFRAQTTITAICRETGLAHPYRNTMVTLQILSWTHDLLVTSFLLCCIPSPAALFPLHPTFSRSNYFSYIASLGWIHLCSHSRDA